MMVGNPFGKAFTQRLIAEQGATFTLPGVSVFVGDGSTEGEPGQAIEHIDRTEMALALVEAQRDLPWWWWCAAGSADLFESGHIHHTKSDPDVKGQIKLCDHTRNGFVIDPARLGEIIDRGCVAGRTLQAPIVEAPMVGS